MRVKICGVQQNIVHLNPEKNMEIAELAIKHANIVNANIICFPEIFLTGPIEREVNKYSQEIPGSFTDRFCKLARENELIIIMGSIIEKDDYNFYNTSVLISECGEMLGVYRKNYLWHTEKSSLKTGSKTPVFKTDFGKIGINICWDLAFPEIAKKMALKGAKMIFCPSYWQTIDKYGAINPDFNDKIPKIDAESRFIDSCVQARAFENELAYIFVNAGGSYQSKLVGHTQIATPWYGTIAKLGRTKVDFDLLIREIDLDLIDLAENSYKIREDSRSFK